MFLFQHNGQVYTRKNRSCCCSERAYRETVQVDADERHRSRCGRGTTRTTATPTGSAEATACQPPHEVTGQNGRGGEGNDRGRMAGEKRGAGRHRPDEARRKGQEKGRARPWAEARKRRRRKTGAPRSGRPSPGCTAHDSLGAPDRKEAGRGQPGGGKVEAVGGTDQPGAARSVPRSDTLAAADNNRPGRQRSKQGAGRAERAGAGEERQRWTPQGMPAGRSQRSSRYRQ